MNICKVQQRIKGLVSKFGAARAIGTIKNSTASWCNERQHLEHGVKVYCNCPVGAHVVRYQ